jgi:hypothetical protein
MYVRSLPKVFHTCGKNCGKSPGFGAFPSKNVLNPDTTGQKIAISGRFAEYWIKAVTVGDFTEP